MFNSFPIPKPDTGGGSNIKSYQSGVITWTNTTTTRDIPITDVDMAKSIIRVNLYHDGTVAPNVSTISPLFVDTGLIRLTRFAGGTLGTSKINWEVIEFNNVKSKQTGSVATSGGTENTVTISSVNPLKCLLEVHNISEDTITPARSLTILMGRRIISSTSIGITGSLANTAYFQIIEFN